MCLRPNVSIDYLIETSTVNPQRKGCLLKLAALTGSDPVVLKECIRLTLPAFVLKGEVRCVIGRIQEVLNAKPYDEKLYDQFLSERAEVCSKNRAASVPYV